MKLFHQNFLKRIVFLFVNPIPGKRIESVTARFHGRPQIVHKSGTHVHHSLAILYW